MASRQRGGRGRRIHLLHVEADEFVLLGFRSTAPREWAITSFRTFDEQTQPPARGTWDVCLLGLRSEEDGVREAFAHVLRLQRIGCPLVAWLPVGAAQYVPTLKALGVTGFVALSAPVRQLHEAILDVVSGKAVIDPRLRERLPEQKGGTESLGLNELQLRVAALYVLHGNRRLVARDLHVSENTIKYHLRRIYAKTGTSSVHELYRLLLSRGWAPPEPLDGQPPADEPPPGEAAPDGPDRDGPAGRRS